MNLKAIGLIITSFVAVAGLFWLSPYWAVTGLATAAQDYSVDLVPDYVDIDMLSDNFHSQMRASKQGEIDSGRVSSGDLFHDALILETMINRLVRPGGVSQFLSPELHDPAASRITTALNLIRNEEAGWTSASTYQPPVLSRWAAC